MRLNNTIHRRPIHLGLARAKLYTLTDHLMKFAFLTNKILKIYHSSSKTRMLKYLREQGVQIGENVFFQSRSFNIDISRPSLVSIGDNCYFNRNFTLLTHDWVTNVFIHSGKEFINSSGRVQIGNNVSFGQNVMVLKGVTIGDNCFIGAGSIVTKDIPANSIAAGSPCKVIMSLDDYYQRRLDRSEAEALDYARSIQERFGRRPVPADFWEEFIWFVSGDEIDEYPEIPIRSQLGPIYDQYVSSHKAKYNSFEEFLNAAGL